MSLTSSSSSFVEDVPVLARQGVSKPQPEPPAPHHHHHHHHKKDAQVQVEEGPSNHSGINENRDCYCEPNWYCCFNRCMDLEYMVAFTAFFDAFVYTILTILCAFVVLTWRNTGRFVEARALSSGKNLWWREFMFHENGDGIYILMAAYGASSFAGWLLGLRYKTMKRCPGIWWMLNNIYTTGLIIVSMSVFPFRANFYNLILLIFRVYSFWIVWTWDRYLVGRNYDLTVEQEHTIEDQPVDKKKKHRH